MSDPFQLLADPTRRRLVELTAHQERSVNDLVAATGLSQPAVSKQLGILRGGGMVTVRQEGTKRFYRTRTEELSKLRAWLDHYGAEWNATLDALEEHLDKM